MEKRSQIKPVRWGIFRGINRHHGNLAIERHYKMVVIKQDHRLNIKLEPEKQFHPISPIHRTINQRRHYRIHPHHPFVIFIRIPITYILLMHYFCAWVFSFEMECAHISNLPLLNIKYLIISNTIIIAYAHSTKIYVKLWKCHSLLQFWSGNSLKFSPILLNQC